MIQKRDGRKEPFNKSKIKTAIFKAFKEVDGEISDYAIQKAENISSYIEAECEKKSLNISEVQSLVENGLMSSKRKDVARAYIEYRHDRDNARGNSIDKTVWGVVNGNDSNLKDNSNKNTNLISTMRDLVAEEVSKDIALREMLPKDIAKAHKDGLIYVHDLGHYLNPSLNCCLVNLYDMLQNGTVINGKGINKPHTFRTACTIASQIVAQVASGQFGGQTISLAHLAPFVADSRNVIKKEVCEELEYANGYEVCDDVVEAITEKRLEKEIKDGIQTLQYQINTLQTSNGQAPFLSIFMYINEYPEYEKETVMLIKEMLKQRIQGMQNEVGAWIAPAFPKLLYVLDENNTYEDSKYFWLTKLASECVVKRMMPDFISAKIMKENYENNVFPCMGCRAWLSPYKGSINNIQGEYKWYGRMNMGLTSINLADAGLSAQGDLDNFWDILDDRLELCHKSLLHRYKKLKDVNSDTSPIHWQYGAIARLPKHAPIYPLLQNGYTTISLGYIGVYECVMALIGKSHTTKEGRELALKIMHKLRDTVDSWKKIDGLGWALYSTPSESLTDRFARLTRERWGVIKGITDRNFLTNSYHVFVEEPINPFDKIKFESQFCGISSGGNCQYIEMSDMKNNTEAVIKLMQYMYETTQYAEFNTKLDYCQECGFDGEILCDDSNNWYCPNCGNKDTNKMNIVRRTCGYLGENLWNEGRTEEIKNRYVHLDNHILEGDI